MEAIVLVTGSVAGTTKAFLPLILAGVAKLVGGKHVAAKLIKEGAKEVAKDKAKEAIQKKDKKKD